MNSTTEHEDLSLLEKVVRLDPEFKLTTAARDRLKAHVLKQEYVLKQGAATKKEERKLTELSVNGALSSSSEILSKLDIITNEVAEMKNTRHLGMYGTLSAMVNWDVGIRHGKFSGYLRLSSLLEADLKVNF